ncbi:MAG: hypothetical protein M1839_004891 [Geoglossum umbratile]|nr:MAG: hypothetical protein M1839_004891 [Geoglossum umbratile]
MFAEGNENIVRVFNSETGATSSAEYRDLTTQAVPLDMGLEGLCGCTILVVVSQEAVYFAHFFEDMAFIKGDRRNAPEPDFQGQVLSFLESGLPRLEPGTKRRKKNGERYDSLKQHADSFKTGVKAFILTPQNETKDAPGDEVIYVPGQLYEEQINQLKMKVLEILPDAGIIEYMYQAVNAKTAEGMKALDKTAKGKALYQFDPEQRKDLQKVWENWR